MDPSRLLSTNDGWEQVESDIYGIHDYIASWDEFSKRYENKETALTLGIRGRLPYAYGVKYSGQPF